MIFFKGRMTAVENISIVNMSSEVLGSQRPRQLAAILFEFSQQIISTFESEV